MSSHNRPQDHLEFSDFLMSSKNISPNSRITEIYFDCLSDHQTRSVPRSQWGPLSPITNLIYIFNLYNFFSSFVRLLFRIFLGEDMPPPAPASGTRLCTLLRSKVGHCVAIHRFFDYYKYKYRVSQQSQHSFGQIGCKYGYRRF